MSSIFSQGNKLKTVIFSLLLCFSSFLQAADDKKKVDAYKDFSVSSHIGSQESPTVHIELDVKKTRDLHVAIQEWGTWRNVKSTRMRIKKSGKYHFSMDVDGLKPGKYRVNSYLTPRKKDWNDRLTQADSQEMEIVEEPKYVEPIAFSDEDKIKNIKWPKKIDGVEENILRVDFDITEPRDLIVRLLNSENWKEMGSIKFTVKEPGHIQLPFNNMTVDFPAGKYAWNAYLAPLGSKESVSKKQGKHFVLGGVAAE